MARVKVGSSVIVQWHDLVKDAQSINGRSLSDEIEHYLIILLQRYTDRPGVLASALALEYLQAMEKSGSYHQDTLRDVGDKCLLFSGLFPLQAEARRVPINYFIDLGRSSYNSVSVSMMQQEKLAKLFAQLEQHFVGMMDVLHVIREMSGIEKQLPLLHAIDLWEHTHSDYAKLVIDRHVRNYMKKN